jgi:lactate dehydrogenase-like 2-hydroxyacid dehydrogenase
MKFKKIVSFIPNEALDSNYWQKIDAVANKRVMLAQDDHGVTKELADADCLLILFNGVDRITIERAPNLKYIGALATGVGKIDTKYARSKNITVTNIPGYSTEAVAELTFAVLLEYLREICRAKTESKQTRTSEDNFHGAEIKGKDFGVVGLGRIGSRVAEIAGGGFGANIYYFSRSPKQMHASYRFERLDQLVKHCDFISINLELNDETAGIFNAEIINNIKPKSVVINTAPLELFDLNALDSRLAEGDITFIFDHTDPGDINDSDLQMLKQYENCITYPVLGYVTDEARTAKQEIFVNNLESFLLDKPVNIVN